ncbi:MAG TPA: phosphatidylserine decarboxylase [Vicinamibacterales bacterium]|nr:phosphatidylserine decarboxylase [Vicinamibacterales bacterium]
MKIDRAGFPFIAAAALPAAAFTAARRYGWAASFAALGGFFAYFFRDPDRAVPQDPGLVVSPADGRVMIAGKADPATAPPGEWTQVAIFLSPVDVHVNRSPVAGRVTRIAYKPGRFLPAYDARAGENESNEVWVDANGATIVFRQVVGILARRIVCRIQEGQFVARGERVGLMKFGSRMDVFLPTTAVLAVEPGQQVVGGETVLAVLGSRDAA